MSRRTLTRSASVLLATLAAACFLTACNTVSGLGKDIQSASDNTAEAIDDAFDGD